MELAELEREVARLCRQPPTLVCAGPDGRERLMSLRECVRTGSRFIHLARDSLDELLAAELSGDNGEIGLTKEGDASCFEGRKRLTNREGTL